MMSIKPRGSKRKLSHGECSELKYKRLDTSFSDQLEMQWAAHFGNTHISCLLPLRDGSLLSAVSSPGESVRVWHPNSGLDCMTFLGHMHAHFGVRDACQLQNDFIATAASTEIILWDLAQTQCKQQTLMHQRNVSSICSLSDGNLAVLDLDNGITVWDIKSGEKQQTPTPTITTAQIFQLRDGRLAAGGLHGAIQLLDMRTPHGKSTAALKGHTRWINGFCQLQDGTLVSYSDDNAIKLWNIQNGRCLATLVYGEDWQTNSVRSLCQLHDGRLLAGYNHGTARVWNPTTGECEMSLPDKGSLCCQLEDGRVAFSGRWQNHDSNTISLLQ